MELRLLTRDQIDVERWDILIKEAQFSIFYAYHWYLDVVCKEWQIIVLQEGVHYKIGMPLPIKRKWGMVSIEQPLFCPYLGLFSRTDILPVQVQCFLKFLNQSFSYISSYSFKWQESKLLLPALAVYKTILFQLHTTYTLPLNRHYEAIYADYFKDKKANVRKSKAYAFQIRDSIDINPLIALFRENHAGNVDGGVADSAYNLLREVFKVLQNRSKVELKYGWVEDQIVSGVLIVEEGLYACYLFNASQKSGRIYHVRASMLDDYFNRKAASNLLFDFESPRKISIANYYKSFGAHPQFFLEISKNVLPFPLRQIQNLRKRFFQMRRALSKEL
jgi:hypothetical protein